jgi:hypothetical protein
MKNKEQIAVNLAFCFIVLLSLTCPAQADDTQDATGRINLVICAVINLIQMVVGAIAAIVIIFAGVRWMLSGDDPSARNGAKTIIIGAFVGIIIIAIAIPVINYVTSGMINGVNCDIIPGADAMRYANQAQFAEARDAEAKKNIPKQNLPNLQIGGITSEIDPETEDLILKITIKNTGIADAGDVRVQFFRNGVDICYHVAMYLTMYGGPIKPGEERTVNCRVTKDEYYSLMQGINEELYIMADSDKKIEESDETDNKAVVGVEKLAQPGIVRIASEEPPACGDNTNNCIKSTLSLSCGDKTCVIGQRCKLSGFSIFSSCNCEDDDTCPSAPPKIEFVLGVDEPYGMDPETNKPYFNFIEKTALEYEPGTDTIQMRGRISIEFSLGWTSCDCSYGIDESKYSNNIEIGSYQPNLFPIEISTSPPSRTVTVKVGCFCDGIWGGATDTVSISPKT